MLKHLHLFWVVAATLLPSLLFAQPINVPSVSGQYLIHDRDYSAVQIHITFTNNEAAFVLSGEEKAFTQSNLYTYLNNKFEKTKPEVALQTAIQVHAVRDLPMSFFQSLYVWLQIYGCREFQLVGREGSEMKYIPLTIMPFPKMKVACELYSSKNNSGDALATLNTLHTGSSIIEKGSSANLPTRAEDYIPHKSLELQIKGDNSVLYKGKPSNPMVLGTFMQNELFSNYQSMDATATPNKYFWLSMDIDDNATYQTYLETIVALQEGYYQYWDELAFGKYQKMYGELSIDERIAIKKTSPMLITQYTKEQKLYLQSMHSNSTKPSTWTDKK